MGVSWDSKLHSLKTTGESVRADFEAALKALWGSCKFESIIQDQGNVFNGDESGSSARKLLFKTCISQEEKSPPAFKVGKERLTLPLGEIASGDRETTLFSSTGLKNRGLSRITCLKSVENL